MRNEERTADLQPGCARFVLPRVFQVTKFHVNRYKQCAMPHACASLYDLSFGCPLRTRFTNRGQHRTPSQ